MAMEEAAQEVRRILCQNDVGETLNYLSTVTRCIEDNQHDLRAVIGNSYRDLLGACDGVVGMERDCADILTIEEAMERASATRDVDGRGNAEMNTEPLLPPSWFAARLRRQRRAAAATLTTTADNNNTASSDKPPRLSATKGYAVTNGGTMSEGDRGASATTAAEADRDAHRGRKTELNAALALPTVELPLPHAAPTHTSTKYAHRDAAVVGEETGPAAPAAQRMRLADELQALHLDYMTLASATASMARGAAAADAELSSLLADSSVLASLLRPADQHDEQQDGHSPGPSHRAASDAAALSAASGEKREAHLRALERDQPLARLARRLHSVQASLRVYAGGNVGAQFSQCVSDAATASSAALAGVSVDSTLRSAKRPPSWATGIQRRATALEARLVKLMLQRLRRAADDYASLAEQVPKVPSGADLGEPLSEARAVRAAEKRHLMCVWAVFAQCHVALRALRDSPTLVKALVACAPGAELPAKRVCPSGIPGTESATAPPTMASLDSAVDALFQLATQDVRAVVSAVVGGAASVASAPAGRTAGDEALPGAADPCRMLLAFLAVLLLRESQLSAARWAAVAPSLLPAALPSSGAQPAVTTADASPQPPSVFLNSSVVNQRADAAAGRTSNRAKPEGDAPPSSHSAASPETRVFATATHLSALGLAAATANGPKASTAASVATVNGTSNTAWALRCFSGLAYLLRAFADYVDLVQATLAEVASTPAVLDKETAALYLLQRICLAAAAASEEQLRATGHGTSVAALGRCEDERPTFPTPALASGARSLDELLQWRLRKVCGSAAASGVPGEGPDTPHGSLKVGGTDVLPLPIGRNGTPMTPMGDPDSVASAKVAPEVAPSQSRALARRRAYVELLRASVNTVDELQASGASSMALGERSLSVRADVVVTENTSATSGATDLVPPLRLVCHQLLAPLVSSLVVLLARDPVALAVYSEGQRNPDTRPAMRAVRDALERLLPNGTQQFSLSGTQGSRMPSSFSGLGQTWTTVNEARWWELVEQTTMRAALQRCVTVALESVSFVEACISQGLAASAYRMLQSSVEDSQTKLGHRVSSIGRDGGTSLGPTRASALECTWSALFSVLRLHVLSTVDSVSDAGGALSLEGAEISSGTETRHGAVHGFDGATTSAPISGLTGRRDERGSLSSAMTGICWDRFRPRTAAGAAGSAHRSFYTTSGEGIFREEGLEWGRAAYQAAQLPLSVLPDAANAKRTEQQQQQHTWGAAAVDAGLSASQQAQLAKILSGMRDKLFPDWAVRCIDEHDTTRGTRPGALDMNGHAAELLHRCLLTLVEAVQAQTASVQASACKNSAGSPPSTPPLLLLPTRIVGWLKDALHRVAVQLRNADPGVPPNGAHATVVHSYELSLLVRVYWEVLQRLQTAAPPSEATGARQLCTDAADLYERAQAPWQDMLTQFYRAALQQAYNAVLRLRESGTEEPRHSAAANRAGAALRRVTHLMDSAAWVRAPMAGPTAPDDNNASGSHGVAYPAQPTPAVMTLTQVALRYLHQALYGAPSVYSDSPVPFMSFPSRTEATYGAASISEQLQSGAASAAASVGFSDDRGCRLHVLVTGKVQQRALERLAATSAELYEFELCPLVDVVGESGDSGVAARTSALPPGNAAPATAAATQNQADDLRLQWYMDVLFASSVWCAGSVSGGGGGSSAGLFATERDSPVKALFTPDTGGSGVGVDATACVAEGPLRRVVRHLEGTCDPVRWRSGVPLILAAYRQFISASALLWVAHSEEPHDGDAGDTHNEGAFCATSVAAAAATRPFSAAGAMAAAPFLTEKLLLPRERVNRLALLPIAASSSAALASASIGAGGTPSAASARAAAVVPQTYSLLLPTASELNPYAPSSSSSVGVPPTGPYRFGGPSSAVAAASAGASGGVGINSLLRSANGGHDASAALLLGGVGAADMIGVGEVAVPADSSSAAAAASSLWGTTQRGWSQLWGTS
ncbi:Conserved oligomeric Golgi complex subunit 1 [Leishmania donovani]|uniref:Conserved oligomeric Golgi complex subunit 1 n=1 Tax=Leishmania donovani TaxID=5661 RepID=A0A6J8F2F0_LEIDO|nr:Conserved oligomeric Golgi complex subunit 1 [Leishmania donovani]VDZ41591.1 Vps51/Vps67_putative/Pfam:PF08700 [Leishmania donovani]